MQGLIKRHRGASSQLLASLLLTSGLCLGLSACSGDDSAAEASDEGLTPEGMLPGAVVMMPSGNPAEDDPSDATEADQETPAANEGAPSVTELDDSGETPADDAEANAAGETPVATPEELLEVSEGDYCEAVADWDPEWAQFEEEVLLLVNESRSQPADCGVEGQFPAAAPVRMDPILRCSARLHSLDMFERDFFDHVNPDGVDPFQRMNAAGFSGGGGGENIAVGQSTPEEVMQAWMESDGHCANVMRDAFDAIGVAYHPGEGRRGLGSNYWTQNFGAPPFMRGGGGRMR
jgi:uncharacterized protein YkwD